ncbi:uncharacterized protein Z518_00493 [Rhinocladiella mackenziei CBS 650.93]|uniref:Elongator complex protein 5 n=1 Tax=Rhinocladiella mackenziei CBS 650.93 TaxID=1442369 RepID=A0A0D2HFE3_9EURO|nr:uncharacterized protein Z518_00493 [Rhinocladiella mackenziei CBS 650.93]KIX09413.1 hypothetical protein Z518_00493 [Rhinocladiella mackenziei CBS 650.93]
MSHTNLSHRRTHNLLLISKLLSQRDHASPFTLVLDTLEQPGKPLLREYLRRARLGRTSTIFLSFETFVKAKDANFFIKCYDDGRPVERIAREVRDVVEHANSNRFLIIIDSLSTIASKSTDPALNLNLTAFLSSLLQPPQTKDPEQGQPQISLVAVYHTDVPLPYSSSSSASAHSYSPSPLSLLSYLATTIITVHSLPILLAAKSARAKSRVAPVFGLAEEVEGVVIGLKPKSATLRPEERGIVLELEHRRKSGRGVLEWYFLPTATRMQQGGGPQAFREIVTLLDDHPQFRRPKEQESSGQDLSGMTFELGLTDRQRLEREGVVLPYFDAQKAGGGGEGGRILYDMGVEDDFDEEEDEI